MFEGARLKVKRAEKHIDDFNDVIAAFVQSDFCRLYAEPDPNTGNSIVKFEMTKGAPDDLSVILGDALHNLRSALDLAAYELVLLAGEKPLKWVRFPVADDEAKLEAAINGGQIKIAGLDIVGLIVKTIRPYKGNGGNAALCALHDLDIEDKHCLLVPTFSVGALSGVDFSVGSNMWTDTFLAVSADGAVVCPISAPGKFELHKHGQPLFNVSFGKGVPFEGQPVVPTLHQLSQLVGGIIKALEKTLLARGT